MEYLQHERVTIDSDLAEVIQNQSKSEVLATGITFIILYCAFGELPISNQLLFNVLNSKPLSSVVCTSSRTSRAMF